jgi:hypothetical protein
MLNSVHWNWTGNWPVWVNYFRKTLKKSGCKPLCTQLYDTGPYGSNALGCANVMNEAGKRIPAKDFCHVRLSFILPQTVEVWVCITFTWFTSICRSIDSSEAHLKIQRHPPNNKTLNTKCIMLLRQTLCGNRALSVQGYMVETRNAFLKKLTCHFKLTNRLHVREFFPKS